PAAALDAEGNRIEAAVREDGSLFAAQDEGDANEGDTSYEDGIAYEEAIADLYARSTTISDKEILEIARKMKPDCTEVVEELGDAQAAEIMDTLADYEEAKASYLLNGETAQAGESAQETALAQAAKDLQANANVSAEWERQDRYTRMGMSAAQTLTSLIPGYTVTSCSEENGDVLVDVDEWMTQGYTEGEDQDTENVSAYRYYFTAVLSEDKEGNWEVASITNTDRNFTWLEDIEEQEKLYDGEVDTNLFMADAAELTESTDKNAQAAGTAAQAAGTAAKNADELQAGMIRTSSLKTYGDGKYTYSPDKAVAYADKWATSRNPAYRQYPGVDCCNFVSQCLYAGGMPKNSEWYPASYAWINCSGAISNFKKYGKFMTATDSNVLRGNPVYYDWNSNGVYDHTAICVGRNSAGTPIIDAHTGDHYHVTWRLSSNGKRATIQLRNGGNTGGTSTNASEGGKWKKVKGKWFYYGANGQKVTGWLTYQDHSYYLNKNGRMVTGWNKINGGWYYFAKSGEMKTGWIKLGTRKYYLGSNGKMQTGWVKSNGKYYYMCSEGYAVTGWRTVNGQTYYMNKNGVMQTGLKKIDGMKYYFDSQGRKTLGWVTVGGKKYFFSPSAGGRAATGYWDINNVIYYFTSAGALNG
ncbi:MAG: amidase domain-containing protein, partial [Lachnospiraceae bacterium]|nr:amidase domain-containing protein [Lachnospiraceae bacterium]